jgi:hypothetical protein
MNRLGLTDGFRTLLKYQRGGEGRWLEIDRMLPGAQFFRETAYLFGQAQRPAVERQALPVQLSGN